MRSHKQSNEITFIFTHIRDMFRIKLCSSEKRPSWTHAYLVLLFLDYSINNLSNPCSSYQFESIIFLGDKQQINRTIQKHIPVILQQLLLTIRSIKQQSLDKIGKRIKS